MSSVSKFWKYSIGILLTLVLSGGSIAAVYVRGCLARAQRYAEHGLWGHVQQELEYYLWLHPKNSQAQFLMAEALIRDERLTGAETVALAIEHLRSVDRSSSLAVQSRIQEARLRLLRLDQPSRAEDALADAIQLDPGNVEANYMLWKLHDLTGRAFLVEPFFWKVYEKSSGDERAFRLGEWYLSQYFPQSANASFDRMLGVIKPQETPTKRTEADRLLRFRKAEPDRPHAHVAMARWFQSEGDPKFALELLQQAESVSHGSDPFLVATAISVLMDLGDFDRAKEWWNRWPQPHDGYEYWLWTGVVHEQVDADYAQAAAAYRRAIQVWPGIIDWRTRHRLVNCLQRSGDEQGAAQERADAKRIESLSTDDLHDRLLKAVMSQNDLKGVEMLADYFAKIGRQKEAVAWQEQLSRLQSKPQPQTPNHVVP
jgi:tetratricopeptide (TPR) repeat protein